MNNFFDEKRIINNGPHEFRRLVQRFLLHRGLNVFSVDMPGDKGADLILENGNERWGIQSKWVKDPEKTPNISILDEMLSSMHEYNLSEVVAVTNTSFNKMTIKKLEEHKIINKFRIQAWDLNFLKNSFSEKKHIDKINSAKLRPYQQIAKEKIIDDLDKKKRALLYLATGLGKTVVASKVINHYLEKDSNIKILVLAHLNELLEQLQRSIWNELSINIPTQIVNNLNQPEGELLGVTFASNLSILKYIEDKDYYPDLVIIDECHHISGDNTYNKIIEMLDDSLIVGVTATPWRGDKFNIESTLGQPSYKCSIEEGMKQNYLAPVNYNLYQDNINWQNVPELSRYNYSIKELNRKLFVIERDEKILDELSKTWDNTLCPKAIIFCQSIPHAENILKLLRGFEKWKNSAILHSGLNKLDRKLALMNFRKDDCSILVAVDILNEGIDVPNVNIICFARVTHSRRIFVQQLGRGLRIAEGKEKVMVLDFAADVRRIAALEQLNQSLNGDDEYLSNTLNNIEFKDKRVQSIMKEWLKDVSDLENSEDQEKIQFPNI